MQIIALGPEVVIDDVEEYHEIPFVRRLHQRLERMRGPVTAVRREGQHAIVSPVSRARKIPDGHELDGGHAELGQIVQSLAHAGKGAARREGADVKLVEHHFLPGTAEPVDVLPLEGAGVDHFARAVDVLRLIARARIGYQVLRVDAKAVATAGARRRLERVPAVGLADHRQGRRRGGSLETQLDTLGRGRPQAEAHASSGVVYLGSERQPVTPPHAHPALGSRARNGAVSTASDRPCRG